MRSIGRRTSVSWEEDYHLDAREEDKRLMGGGVSSHGMRSIVSRWEYQCHMGEGVSSQGRSIVSWDEEYRLKVGVPMSHGRRSIVSWEEKYRLMGKDECPFLEG